MTRAEVPRPVQRMRQALVLGLQRIGWFASPDCRGVPAGSKRGALAQQAMRIRHCVSHAPSKSHQAGEKRQDEAR